MKRSLIRCARSAAAWLLVGAAITVLVAWTLSLADLPKPTMPPRSETLADAWPDTSQPDWTPAEFCIRTRLWWGDIDFAGGGTRTVGSGANAGSSTSLGMEVHRVGLPLRALASTQVLDGRRAAAPGFYSETLTLSPWQIGLRPNWRPNRRIGDTYFSCVLGIRPVWPGFALNTIFYAALAWGLWQVPLAIRLGRRRRKGLCVRCGYDLKGLATGATCPECGDKGI